MPVRRLDPILVDRIAAGEVVERPAAAVEGTRRKCARCRRDPHRNSHRAGGTAAHSRRRRRLRHGGRRSRPRRRAPCDVEARRRRSHAIATLGFRGEALPSIAPVASLEIVSRAVAAPHAHRSRRCAETSAIAPGRAQPPGTSVEVRDLFAATPARLKFLKSDRAEATPSPTPSSVSPWPIPRSAFPSRAMRRAASNGRPAARPRRSSRVGRPRSSGREFRANALVVAAEREAALARGFRRIADLSPRRDGRAIFLRQRPAGPRQAVSPARCAAPMRTSCRPAGIPRSCCYLGCDPRPVDVNVHPAKAEVRFRDAGLVRALVVTAIGDALRGAGIRPVTQASDRALAAFGSGGGLGRAPYREAGWNHDAFAPIDRASSQQADRTVSAALGFAEGQERFDYASRPSGAVSRKHPNRRERPTRSRFRLVLRAPNSMRITSSRRRETVSSSSISMPPMSALSTSG